MLYVTIRKYTDRKYAQIDEVTTMIEFNNGSNSGRREGEDHDVIASLVDLLRRRITDRIEDSFVIETGRDGTGELGICFGGTNGELVAELLRRDGIAVSTASKCFSREIMPIFESLDLPYDLIRGSILFFIGTRNTADQIERALPVIEKTVTTARRLAGHFQEE